MSGNISTKKIVTDGLVLHLDAANNKSYVSGSTTWNDLTNLNNTSSLTNSPTFSSDNAGGIVFDGIDDYIALPAIDTNNNFTLSFWVMRTNDTFTTIIAGVNATGYLQVRSGALSVSLVKSWVVELGNFGITSGVSKDTINNIVITKNGTTFSAYINGKFIGNLTVNQTFTTSAPTLGRNYNLNEPFSGRYYIFSYYNRKLTDSEISQNYNALRGRFNLGPTPDVIIKSDTLFNVDASNSTSYPGSGTTWFDLGDYKFNGSLKNGVTYNSSNGGSLYLDGGSQRIEFDAGTLYTNDADYTFNVWFKNDNFSEIKYVMHRGRNHTANGWSLMLTLNTTGKAVASVVYTSPSVVSLSTSTGPSTLSLNTWYHITGVWKQGVGIYCYVNGVLEGSATTTGTILRSSSLYGWVLGSIDTSTYTSGYYGSAKVNFRALTDAEILADFNATKTRFGY